MSAVPTINFPAAQEPATANATMSLGARGFLLKKMAATGQSVYSPTDTMVSPCTQKLVQSKKRHYTKGKPLTLSASFQSSQLGNKTTAPAHKSSLATSSVNDMDMENVKPDEEMA